jgi:hypothetical protein
VSVQGLASGELSAAATTRTTTSIAAGKVRTVAIKVKPKYVARFQAAKRVFIKTTVSVGQVRVTVRKPVTLSH